MLNEPQPTPPEIARALRAARRSHIYDETEADAVGIAIYTLADPRDLRRTRYVGQTRSPQRRYAQHVTAARLWLPDETPWWVKNVAQRPLYEWIRSMHRDGRRLPVMIVATWVDGAAAALTAERAFIQRCLHGGLPLLNVAAAEIDPQQPLF